LIGLLSRGAHHSSAEFFGVRSGDFDHLNKTMMDVIKVVEIVLAFATAACYFYIEVLACHAS
jgi:hypothetical protein